MTRIIGIDIPSKKRIEIALTYIHGIGRTTAAEIIEKLGIDPATKAEALSSDDQARINTLLQSDEYTVEGDRRRLVQNNIKRLISIGAYRGFRHRLGLPVRGQGTQKNARTRKGNKRKTVANKKK